MQSSNRQKLFDRLDGLESERTAAPGVGDPVFKIFVNVRHNDNEFIFKNTGDNHYVLDAVYNIAGDDDPECDLIGEHFYTDDVCEFASTCDGTTFIFRDGNQVGEYE